MYAAYWNLKLKPFLNVMDRRFLFSSSQHEEAIARLQFIAENNRLAGVLPGIYVHRIVLNAHPEKRIEKRTITEKAGV